MRILIFIISLIPFTVYAFDFSNFGYGNTVNEGSISIDNNVVSGTSHGGIRGSGIVSSEQRSVAQFNAIKSSITADIKIVFSNKYQLQISGDDNIIKLISSTVSNNQLRVTATKNFSTQNPISIIIKMPVLKKIQQSGAGNLIIDNVTKESLILLFSGSGHVSAIGDVKKLNVILSGTGSLNLERLKAETASVAIEGMGNAHVSVSKQLDARIKGMGDIIYSGQASVRKSIQGMGRIAHK